MKNTARRTMARAYDDMSASTQARSNGKGSYQVCDSRRVSQRLPRDEDEDTTSKKNATETTKEIQEDGSEPVCFGW